MIEGQDVGCTKMKQSTGSERRHIHGDKRQRKDKTEITSSREALSVTGKPGRQRHGLQPINTTRRSSQYLITPWIFQLIIPPSPLCAHTDWVNTCPCCCWFVIWHVTCHRRSISSTHRISCYKSRLPHCFTLNVVDRFEMNSPQPCALASGCTESLWNVLLYGVRGTVTFISLVWEDISIIIQGCFSVMYVCTVSDDTWRLLIYD